MGMVLAAETPDKAMRFSWCYRYPGFRLSGDWAIMAPVQISREEVMYELLWL